MVFLTGEVMKTSIKKIICFTSLLSLMACGGGGSDTGTQQTTPTPTPVVLAEKLQTVIAPYYPQSTEQYAVITALNQYRKDLKVGGLNPNANLDIAASNHQYYITSSYRSGEDFHAEAPGRIGFTGETPQARMIKAGYPSNGIAIEVGTAGSGARSIDLLIDTVFHRQALSYEDISEVGISSSTQNGTIVDASTNGSTAQNNAGNFYTFYPYDGQKNVPLTHSAELPWPFPDLPANTSESLCKYTSYPIHFQVQKLAKLDVTSFTLQETSTGLNIPVRLLTNSSNSQINTNFAFIVGTTPLKVNTKYTVRFVGTATGQFTGAPKGILAIDKSWTFTSGDKNFINCENFQ